MGIALVTISLALAVMMFWPKRAAAGEPVLPPAVTPPSSYTKAQLVAMAERIAAECGLDPDLAKAVIQKESSWDPDAINPDDPSYGIMQVTVPIGIAYGIISSADEYRELLKPEKGMRAGCRFLAYLVRTYPLDSAIQMYNLGETKFRKGIRVPDYLAKVKEYYNEFRA